MPSSYTRNGLHFEENHTNQYCSTEFTITTQEVAIVNSSPSVSLPGMAMSPKPRIMNPERQEVYSSHDLARSSLKKYGIRMTIGSCREGRREENALKDLSGTGYLLFSLVPSPLPLASLRPFIKWWIEVGSGQDYLSAEVS